MRLSDYREIQSFSHKEYKVELYEDLGNFFVCFYDFESGAEKTLSFSKLSQAKSVFKDKVKITKLK